MDQLCAVEPAVASVFEAAFLEARRHRWIESQKHARDLGENAFIDWYRRYWPQFLRYRHVEHLVGDRWWDEFGGNSFGVLRPLIDEDELAMTIVDLYCEGGENLEIISWAVDAGHAMDDVFECLLLINMNDARLDPRFQ